MKRVIINFVALLVIGLGAYHLSGVQSAHAASNQVTISATCDCEGEKASSTCTGDKYSCNTDGTCDSCNNRFLGLIKCKL